MSAEFGARSVGFCLRGSALECVLFRAVAWIPAGGPRQCCALQPVPCNPYLSPRSTSRYTFHVAGTRLTNLPCVSPKQRTIRNVLNPFHCSNKHQKRHWLWPGPVTPDMGALVRQAQRSNAVIRSHSPALTTVALQAAGENHFCRKSLHLKLNKMTRRTVSGHKPPCRKRFRKMV